MILSFPSTELLQPFLNSIPAIPSLTHLPFTTFLYPLFPYYPFSCPCFASLPSPITWCSGPCPLQDSLHLSLQPFLYPLLQYELFHYPLLLHHHPFPYSCPSNSSPIQYPFNLYLSSPFTIPSPIHQSLHHPFIYPDSLQYPFPYPPSLYYGNTHIFTYIHIRTQAVIQKDTHTHLVVVFPSLLP